MILENEGGKENMNIREKAEIFAMQAHDGEVRKADPDKPYVVHPIDVANKLRSYGFSDPVCAGGYLHDVVENTRYSLEDIQALFGEEVASFVRGATESSKLYKLSDTKQDVSWYERKRETIERVKGLDLEHKAIVVADKISNLEDMAILFGKWGKVDFSKFNAGYEDHRWYYNSIYESLVSGMDTSYSMLRDLRYWIDRVFEYPDTSFSITKDSILAYQKQELLKLRSLFQTNCTGLPVIGCNEAIYLKLRERLDKIGIDFEWNTEEFSKISYQNNGWYYLISDGYFYTQCNTFCGDKNCPEQQADIIIGFLMESMYQAELSGVKREICKKKRISLN